MQLFCRAQAGTTDRNSLLAPDGPRGEVHFNGFSSFHVVKNLPGRVAMMLCPAFYTVKRIFRRKVRFRMAQESGLCHPARVVMAAQFA
jgi:hypothetical protein